MAKHHPADAILDLQNFGEFGGVNPSIEDSSTYTFLHASSMEELFEVEKEGCYLYSRHTNPNNKYLGDALAGMEGTEAGHCAASGMGSISSVILQLCSAGDEIISSRTIYGGTYAFFKNFLPKFNIKVNFVDTTNLEAIEAAITDKTKVIYCEALSNPLLEITDLPKISALAKKANAQLVVDNTFTPLIICPKTHGADVVIHSLTKFINGTSDAVGGVACGTKEFVASMMDVNSGAAMLLGPSQDTMRSASILKNLRTLPVRMERHSRNAQFLAEKFEAMGLKVKYPGLKSHPQHELMTSLMNKEFGYGGMFYLDMGDLATANKVMEEMQLANIGYLAVSLGFSKTLFSAPGSSTSSEIPEDEQAEMGLSDGIIRFSIGLDQNIERTFERMVDCMKKVGAIL
ncbi:MAG: aminotransferase class V-fold PLP-dependent enzyme [Schleiferiaceae bacterium]